jgi:hypothetical protein
VSKKQNVARERLAAIRAEQARRERRRTAGILVVAGVVAVTIVGASAWGVMHRQSQDAGLPNLPSSGRTSMPPWAVPADTAATAQALGLDVAAMEGTVNHFHAHLDILVDGKPVEVPPNIGIDETSGAMSEMHTHDSSGVLHIEAPTANQRYTLGQLFGEWQVRLTATSMGGLQDDGSNTLRAYVDGERFTGDLADIELLSHQEIALVYGPADSPMQPPASYDFPPGE